MCAGSDLKKGYIAAHCVDQLLGGGYRVRGTVRSLKDEAKLAPLYRIAEKVRVILWMWKRRVCAISFFSHVPSVAQTARRKR